jgi:hypothetical protein
MRSENYASLFSDNAGENTVMNTGEKPKPKYKRN